MPFLLVLIRKSRWLGTVPPFQGVADAPADCLVDLKTEKNELSSWFVDDQKTNLNRLLTALAANRDSFQNIDYITFDFDLPGRLNLTLRSTPGETADSHANRSWHYDLTLSARQLVELAVEIHLSGTKGRLLPKEVQRLVEASTGKELNQAKINKKLAAKLVAYAQRKSFWTGLLALVERMFRGERKN